MATAKNEPQRAILEEQIVALIGDLVPSNGGAVVLGAESHSGRADAVELPLYVRGAVAGTLGCVVPAGRGSESLGSSRDPQRGRHAGRSRA